MYQTGVYAGSFDPWSFGHQFVLEAALKVFPSVHVLAALNPLKSGVFVPDDRARIIAHAVDPLGNWFSKTPPFEIQYPVHHPMGSKKIIVACTDGLVAEYARSVNTHLLIRGLRSTTDFEAEFNLYFSNHAIDHDIQTWAVMCPPDLLHCSATFVKTMIGRSHVQFVGTCFLAQSLIMKVNANLGSLLDMIQACSENRFEHEPSDLTLKDLNKHLQMFFSHVSILPEASAPGFETRTAQNLQRFYEKDVSGLRHLLKEGHFPKPQVNWFWAAIFHGLGLGNQGTLSILRRFKKLGKTHLNLFDEDDVLQILSAFED